MRPNKSVGELTEELGWIVLVVICLVYLRERTKVREVNDVRSTYSSTIVRHVRILDERVKCQDLLLSIPLPESCDGRGYYGETVTDWESGNGLN
ncbi:hypothetical protein BDM02DRAFT_3117053 [Thelephora ganbajun]|uniref:Uncharacterized protein n=1 Tax=Thelephora ganbajun TaxID=370292 RepID=A0ACB6ZD58_THEGA|nr:hypothetical protein BDM02DRAFT_3117053 [Thelephora ganbajun]